MTLIVIFWCLLLIVLYTFIGYPIILKFFQKLKINKKTPYKPTVTLLIVAHNEENQIADKLRNSQQLDYSKKLLQVLVVSDGSTDQTVNIAKKFSDVDILELSHGGKTKAQNEGVKLATGEIIIFSDANSIYKKSAVQLLVENFSDPLIGCACGELQYKNKGSQERLYWSYEILVKQLEGRCGRLLGANGSIYAVRKSLYIPLADDAISDFLEPILIYIQGKKILYIPEAIAFEEEPINTFQRKRRIILRSLVSLKYALPHLNPLKNNNIFFNFVSHKFLRWFMPIFLIAIFITNLLIIDLHLFYLTIFVLQSCFYVSGLFIKPVKYFIIVHGAALIAIIDWFSGKKITKWSVIRS